MTHAKLEVIGAKHPLIHTADALAFVADLHREFAPQVGERLARRKNRQLRFNAGERPGFLPETEQIRQSEWTVAPIPNDLTDRRVEITGPVDAKMIINALNSGANVFMADFEDASSPTWANMTNGQANLFEAVRRTLTFRDESKGKTYALKPEAELATLMVRPRGWHLIEKHVVLQGAPAIASLVDFGLYFFHNAAELLRRGSGPYFYLPKLESHLEARLWNDVFRFAQQACGLPNGTIRATVLIETLPAAFEMDEILFELRDHSAGLNCGRWDYIFSFIKTFRAQPNFVLPDRSQVGMQQPFMAAYSNLVVDTCHRRGVHAMGGMAAQSPIKTDEARNLAALEKVRVDKLREVKRGHDGTWVAHPGLIPIAREVFDAHMPTPNQIHRRPLAEDGHAPITCDDLLEVPRGIRTLEGLRLNIRIGIQYIEAWLRGNGCVPLYNLMEDAATAEISRAQVWQWIEHVAALDDGQVVTPTLVHQVIEDEMKTIAAEVGAESIASGRFEAARALFESLCTAPRLADFLTSFAYDQLEPSAPGDTDA